MVDFDWAPHHVAIGSREILENLALSDQFAIAETAKVLLDRAQGHVPTGRTLVELHTVKLPKRKAEAVLSLDVGDRVEFIEALWPEFPSLLASQFDFVWNSSKDNSSNWRSREELAHSVSSRSYPRAPILSWSREVFEGVFQEVLNHVKPLAIDGNEMDKDIVRAVLNRLLPDIRTYVAHWHSRIVRPSIPLPIDQTSGFSEIAPLTEMDEFGGWIRLGYYEEQVLLEADTVLPKCIGEIHMSGGIVSGRETQGKEGSVPFGVGNVNAWWGNLLDMPRDRAARFIGPLVGLTFVGSFLGICPILTPHPKYLDPCAARLAQKPGPLVLRDANGKPCVRFRWWKVKPLGKYLTESAPRLQGCDLVVRQDIWQHISQMSKPPLVFERAISRQDKI